MEHDERKQRAEDAGCSYYDDHEFVYVGVELGAAGVASDDNRVWKFCTRCGGLTYVPAWWLGYMENPTGVSDATEDES